MAFEEGEQGPGWPTSLLQGSKLQCLPQERYGWTGSHQLVGRTEHAVTAQGTKLGDRLLLSPEQTDPRHSAFNNNVWLCFKRKGNQKFYKKGRIIEILGEIYNISQRGELLPDRSSRRKEQQVKHVYVEVCYREPFSVAVFSYFKSPKKEPSEAKEH